MILELILDKAGCKSFFKKHPQNKKVVQTKISSAIEKEVQTGMSKVKLATRKKINNLPCYEMRLNLGKAGSIRITFTVYDNQATVYYLTKTKKKSEFSKELDKALRGIL